MTVQVLELSFANSGSPTANALQLIDLSFGRAGAAPVVSGTVAPKGPVRGGDLVTFNLTIDGSYTSVVWSSLGLPVSLSGTDTQKTISAPYSPDLGDVILGVTATGPGGTSQQIVLTVSVLPWLDWYMDASSVWQPFLGENLL